MPTKTTSPKKASPKIKAASKSKKYNKMTQYEHIWNLPDTYIGSTERDEIEDIWIWNSNEERMEQKNITLTKGLYKIFDEIIVNAEDQEKRSQQGQLKNPVTKIEVTIDEKTGEISVENNGDGIDVEIYDEFGIYAPELIFGNLLTSENYTQKKKIVGGKNGYGAKLTNIYSKYFKIETIDAKHKLKYTQTFTKNMLEKTKPKITKNSGAPYTKITFLPDYERFSMSDGIDEDTIALFKKRVYDICACTSPSVTITLNKKNLKIKSFEQYVNLYIGSDKKKVQRVCESPNSRWDVCICTNPTLGNMRQVSFVNGINTFLGGKHVQYIARNIANNLRKRINEKLKKDEKPITATHVINRLWVFVRCDIEDPVFDSQTKENLTTPVAKFGSKCEFSDKFYKNLLETDLKAQIMALSAFDVSNNLSKTDGKKSSSLRGIPKLDDANMAGTTQSQNCTLVLTEGDSAKASAVAAISAIPKGKDFFGVFPLKGKMLNVRGESMTKVSNNAEIINIKQIIGLKVYEKNSKKFKVYTKENIVDLRYGRVIILTDQDVDGSHIRGLFLNFIHYYWPTLLDPKVGFVTTVATPIIKATLTASIKKKKPTVKAFYTLTEYETWKTNSTSSEKWTIKYYKGLGTSTAKEAKDFFDDLQNKLVTYLRDDFDIDETLLPDYNGSIKTATSTETPSSTSAGDGEDADDSVSVTDEEEPVNKVNFSDDRIRLAFDKGLSNRRKVWLSNYDRTNILQQTERIVSLQDFIDKELIHFSSDDNIRSIPSMIDGFKPSQRKILFGTIKKHIQCEIKVSQLTNYISEQTCYHHGESSLSGTIVNMAQDFVGSNNINLLKPNGQFGTRLQGGKDAAADRYIFTALQDITRCIFHPDDDPILNYLDDEGTSIEPEFYVPIIPTILINGTTGIGTGFSTSVPLYNPIDIVNNLKNRICGEKYDWIKPWYSGFKGDIKWLTKEKKFTTIGNYEVMSPTMIKITELPICQWTENYYNTLDKFLDDAKEMKTKSTKSGKSTKTNFSSSKTTGLISYKKYHTDTSVEIHLKINKEKMIEYMDSPELFIKTFKLESSKPVQYTNMCLFDKEGHIRRYPDVYAIINAFYKVRLSYYVKRKDYKLKELKYDYDVAQARIRFIEGVVDKTINVLNVEESKITEQLESLEFPKFVKVQYEITPTGTPSYDYLLTMPIRTLTTAKISALKSERDNRWAQYEALLTKTPKSIWMDDLNEFLAVYKKFHPSNKKKIKTFSPALLAAVETDVPTPTPKKSP